MDSSAPLHAQRVTFSARQVTEADGVDPRFAEVVRAAIFEEHSIELVSGGGAPDWNGAAHSGGGIDKKIGKQTNFD
ncbi:hypothetical protein TcBrA4_0038820 [Trypanosoma cruzi]|nr:hypothetical protein TcBrA4_0038820 [Trypanosoma cruzi]